MPLYKFKAKDSTGKQIVEKIEAENENVVVEKLTSKGLFVTSIEEFNDSEGLNANINLFQARVPAETISTFFVQLSIMIKSGISLVEALKSLESGERSRKF